MTDPSAPVTPVMRDLSMQVRTVARFVVGVLLAGLVGALIFLILVQEGFRRGYTDFDFNHVLGTLVKGTADEARSTQDALGIVGDTAGPSGVYSTIAAAFVIVAGYALVIRVVRRHWLLQGFGLAAVTFLALGLGFGPYADSRLDTPTGFFGIDAGAATPLVMAVAALGFGITAARVYGLVHDAGWWEPTRSPMEDVLQMDQGRRGSLELPEEGRQGGRVGT